MTLSPDDMRGKLPAVRAESDFRDTSDGPEVNLLPFVTLRVTKGYGLGRASTYGC
jgi:hypothetical protein